MPFVKGQSGNPSGRPKVVAAVRDLARVHAEDGISTLVSIMKDTANPPAARVAAAKEILDRGFGKAPQPMDGDGEGGPIKTLNRVERVVVDPNAPGDSQG
jgi:hypothetical protein